MTPVKYFLKKESIMQCDWYAVRTRSRHEQKVKSKLIKKSFEIFYPQIEAWSKRKDRKKKILKSLFPGYLFINCILTKETWLEIVKTYGVADILGDSHKPIPIPADQILSIRTLIDSGESIKSHPYLNTGDKVIVAGGSLKGAVGIYKAYDHKKGKLIVSVDLLSRSIEVEIESEYVEAF